MQSILKPIEFSEATMDSESRINFIERGVFAELLQSVTKVNGGEYTDMTAYGDMSRLVVALIAKTPSTELKKLYNDLGWKSDCMARAMKEAALKWFSEHHPNHRFANPDSDHE